MQPRGLLLLGLLLGLQGALAATIAESERAGGPPAGRARRRRRPSGGKQTAVPAPAAKPHRNLPFALQPTACAPSTR